MLKNPIINLKIVEKVASALEEINEEVLYVGGAVVSLYITDEGAEQSRPTKDIDISVQISSYSEMDVLREKLESKNIYPASTETILYRYALQDILIDFIPFEDTPLGPTNRWLKPGFDKAYPVEIGRQRIRILPVSWYLATKWEAFKNRGSDPRTSHDFEDIIYVIDNNLELVENVNEADKEIQDFLKEMASEILSHPNCNEIIECHLNPYTRKERYQIVNSKLESIVAID